jgi:hypothetical protein
VQFGKCRENLERPETTLIGDGLLPPDIDGKQKPRNADKIPIVGTQDDEAPYGATFDAINIWDLEAAPSAMRTPISRVRCRRLSFRRSAQRQDQHSVT